MELIKKIENEQLREDNPDFRVGDTVRVSYRIKEGDKTRLQDFEGVVIKINEGNLGKTFTLRRLSYGVGVERTFLYHSPRLEVFKVVRRGKVRRAKLNYLRGRQGKAAKVKEKTNY
ncbi:50S ribosomal protein L19 [Anaerococcus vaginalis]|uniref:Large ribosomal subunit protein bL19 n=2 Tax=Anaerococcus vaginalis TaxID=33037 RepID=C7HUV0_9FIRM|nr:50S ribosomal protein L19 [Anaerococcus vaginalis]EEU12505.1 ribosomal protein L19 [Anaerococcus vaginalis ATCC 51170]QQB61477.1 50S ribosomal protein L19 [Anaerococcus vaginalis]